MKTIEKIRLFNYKRFQSFEVAFDPQLNILVGDNEAGKSSILSAIDLVISGSKNKVELQSLEALFNMDICKEFLEGSKKIEDLPIMFVELYLNEQNNPMLNGKNNSEGRTCDGIRLTCEPMDEYGREIQEILSQDDANFPFEYYSIRFTTFAGEPYTGYRKFLNHLVIDSSQISNEYATQEYVKTMYRANVTDTEKIKHQNEYRKIKNSFKDSSLSELNDKLDEYQFTVKTGFKSKLETDLTITEDEIPIENKGKGRQCFIKTEFALQKTQSGDNLDTLLLEEPENHLSHINMKKLVRDIAGSEEKQLFIATHNNLISSRLDLRKTIMLNSNSDTPILLKDLPEETAKFFIKAPDNNILEYILSSKVILVEGDAEFILIEALYKNLTGEKLEDSNIHVISVGGTSFKRYLDLAKLLNIKTAVIRDNDKDAQTNCVDNYTDYVHEKIGIFYETDNTKYTFEVCMYELNKKPCDELFLAGRTTLTVEEYMLKNKADVAFKLLDKKSDDLVTPKYIQEAIEWIRE